MAKNMAVIYDGIVENVIWCADRRKETDTLIECNGIPVAIGDEFRNGMFYRGGEKVQPTKPADNPEYAEALQILGVIE